MSPHQNPPALVIHDGELSDVCSLLEKMGTPFEERCGPSTEEDETRAWEIVISTPRRLLEFDAAGGVQPARIAIMEKESRTLRSMLHRAGVDLLVRRPVHPEALRLLVLHTLYRGPEKRRSLRASVGGQVRIRSGLRRRTAVLAELSDSGCRLLAPSPIERGDRIHLHMPAGVANGKSLSLSGNVVRCGVSDAPRAFALAVSWGNQRSRTVDRLREIVASYGEGPAMLATKRSNDAPAFAVAVAPVPERDVPASQESDAEGKERRTSDRHEYGKHVIALGVEAARVLLGRDISLGGMRVQPHEDVSVGDELSIAIHVRPRERPLVVTACVARDEGEDGLVLQWRDLPPEARDTLSRMVEFLPVLATEDGSDEGTGLVVSEILDLQPPDD
jgi:hypothetical protein